MTTFMEFAVGSFVLGSLLGWLIWRVQNRLAKRKRKQKPTIPLAHAFDPDQLMLLFPELSGQSLFDISPEVELEEGDKVVGLIENEFTQQMFRFMQFYARRRAEENVKSQFGPHREEARENACRYSQQLDALKELFFLSARQELNLWGGETVAIRRGWKFVSAKPSGHQGFLRNILGMGE